MTDKAACPVPFSQQPCARCGHSPNSHALDDATNVAPTDPAAKFRCIWPLPDGPPTFVCDCPDYDNPFDEHTRLWADEITGQANTDCPVPE